MDGALRCRSCGSRGADSWLSCEGPFCGRSLADRIAALSEMPKLPEPPEPLLITGPDGRRHKMRYRIWRAPTGICLQLREVGIKPGDGFEVTVLGSHNADVAKLVNALQYAAENEIGRCFLRRSAGKPSWRLAGDEVSGRLEYNPDVGPPRVIVDGWPLSWFQLGEMLSVYEGWRFRLIVYEHCIDLR